MGNTNQNKDMESETILDNQYATLWYYPDHKIVHHQFHRFIFLDNLRYVLNRGLTVLKEHGAQKWLSDDRHHSALIPEDVYWSQKVWFPEAVEAGWKYWAIVTPETQVAVMNMQAFAQQCAEQGIQVQFFADPDEAMTWLIAQNEPVTP